MCHLMIQKQQHLQHLIQNCKCRNEDDKIFKEEESTEILKILGLIENIYFL